MNVFVFAVFLTIFALGSSETNQENKLLQQENQRLLRALKALTAKDVGLETAIGARRYTYERKTGYCKNARGQDGSYSVINNIGPSIAKCETACNRDDKCVAFEVMRKEQLCELHYDATQAISPSGGLPSGSNCFHMGGACNMNCYFKKGVIQAAEAFYCGGKKVGSACGTYLRSMKITGETDPVKIKQIQCSMRYLCD